MATSTRNFENSSEPWSDDGPGDERGDIHLWAEATLEARDTLPEEHDDAVLGLAIHGDVLVSGSTDSKLLGQTDDRGLR